MSTQQPLASPEFSVVIPVYNEEAILETSIRALFAKLDADGASFEIILAENGSIDATVEIAEKLCALDSRLTLLRCPQPNYGLALRLGIERARGKYVICDEIDLGDTVFYHNALSRLRDGVELVVGSKRHPDSNDQRPWVRRQGTQVINLMLRLSLDFQGTDTHGLKAFLREALLPICEKCTVEHDLFASESVIRAGRDGLRYEEIPLTLREIRPPSIGLSKRVPRVLKNLAQLVYTIRIKG